MRHKALVYFTIFIALAIIFSFFFYYYQLRTDKMVKSYEAKITICGNILSEGDCYSRDYCQGIYQPTCPTCQTIEFAGCQNVNEQMVKDLASQKNICQSTGGQWYRSRLGNFCLCDQAGVNKKFDKKLGCISQ